MLSDIVTVSYTGEFIDVRNCVSVQEVQEIVNMWFGCILSGITGCILSSNLRMNIDILDLSCPNGNGDGWTPGNGNGDGWTPSLSVTPSTPCSFQSHPFHEQLAVHLTVTVPLRWCAALDYLYAIDSVTATQHWVNERFIRTTSRGHWVPDCGSMHHCSILWMGNIQRRISSTMTGWNGKWANI